MIKMNTKTRSFIRPRPRHFESIKEDRRMREELRKKEEERVVDKSFYTTNIVGLYSFHILKPQLLTSRSDLELLRRYRIMSTLNPMFYYSNCFMYTLEQY